MGAAECQVFPQSPEPLAVPVQLEVRPVVLQRLAGQGEAGRKELSFRNGLAVTPGGDQPVDLAAKLSHHPGGPAVVSGGALMFPCPVKGVGNEGAVPPRRVAPAHYVDAVQIAVEALLEDLPMQSLRDLVQNLDSSGGNQRVMTALRKKAAVEYGESDANVLGILSELFEWVEKGKFYSGESTGAALAAR